MYGSAATAPAGSTASIAPRAVVARFPGPACLADRDRRCILANDAWRAHLAAGGEGLPTEVTAGLLKVGRNGQPHRALAEIAGASGDAMLVEFTFLPCLDDGAAATLVLASDWTPVDTLRRALTASRDFHRDLALCSTDATFEIDAGGRFTYVGPCGFAGHAEFELIGQPIRDLIEDRSLGAAEYVMTSRDPVVDAELWFRAQSGGERCLEISAMPVMGADGGFEGMRGVGRDVTEARVRDAEILSVRRSRRAIDAVLFAMRGEVRPSAMIMAACASAHDAAELSACFIARAPHGTFLDIVGRAPVEAPEPFLVGHGLTDRDIFGLCSRCLANGTPTVQQVALNGQSILISPTFCGRRLNGAVVFMRSGADLPERLKPVWSDADRRLLRAVSGQIGVTLAQFELFEVPVGGGGL